MQREEIFAGCKHIIDELRRDIDIRIKCDKKFVDEANARIKKVGNYKSKLTEYAAYSGVGMSSSQGEMYGALGAKSLGDLIDHKEEYLTERFYAYVLSSYFPDRIEEMSAVCNKELNKYAQPVYPIIGAVAGAFVSWWLSVGLGALGFLATIALYKKTARSAAPYTRALRAMKSAKAFVEGEIAGMDEEKKKRIRLLSIHFSKQRASSILERMRCEALKAQIDALTRPRSSNAVSGSESACSENVGGDGSARREIVDEYGRTKGYVEDGRMYDEKSDRIGYVGSDNRVYDNSGARTGEVESGGRIREYK